MAKKKEPTTEPATVAAALDNVPIESPDPDTNPSQATALVDQAITALDAATDDPGIRSDEPAPPAPPAPEPTKRGRGRPRKQENRSAAPAKASEPPPPPLDMAVFVPEVAKSLSATAASLSTAAARFAGEHWKFSEEESGALGDAWAPIIAPLLARYPGSVLWVSALSVTYMVLAPRVETTLKLRGKAKEGKHAAAGE